MAKDNVLYVSSGGLFRTLIDVSQERVRQDVRWGEQNHSDPEWLTILTEEVGEAAQEVLRRKFGNSAKGHGDLRSEVVQIAAVAVAWLEALDRRKDDGSH